MGILDAVRSRSKKRKRRRTRVEIHDALDRAFRDAVTRAIVDGADRYVIFSDHHKGGRDGADDFQRCERTYNAALAYYYKLGYHLVELGDVEELWENSFEEVALSYPATLALAAEFQADGRYTRMWGNHDLAWKGCDLFQERMSPFGYGDVVPIEALRLAIMDGAGKLVVELFLVHGHQGTADSDRHAMRSRFFVRYGWRALQRRLNRPWTTPSVDWALRGEHAEHMESWATERGRVLVAGHTHMPVFFQSAKQPAATTAEVPSPDEADPQCKEALRLAWHEWAKAEEERLRRQPRLHLRRRATSTPGAARSVTAISPASRSATGRSDSSAGRAHRKPSPTQTSRTSSSPSCRSSRRRSSAYRQRIPRRSKRSHPDRSLQPACLYGTPRVISQLAMAVLVRDRPRRRASSESAATL